MGIEWGDDTLEQEERNGEKPHMHHMLDQLTAECGGLRKQLSEVGKALAWETPYQANLAERANALKHARDMLQQERDRLKKTNELLKEMVQRAKHRLDDYADRANAGKAQSDGRSWKRQIWAAFADYDEVVDR